MSTQSQIDDWVDTEEVVFARREYADMSEAALLSNYEMLRIACGIHDTGELPRAATMQKFWATWCELRLRREE